MLSGLGQELVDRGLRGIIEGMCGTVVEMETVGWGEGSMDSRIVLMVARMIKR